MPGRLAVHPGWYAEAPGFRVEQDFLLRLSQLLMRFQVGFRVSWELARWHDEGGIEELSVCARQMTDHSSVLLDQDLLE
ncbi:MAG: hypothetical protein ACR2N4_02260 [Jatrophihabitans sp.]